MEDYRQTTYSDSLAIEDGDVLTDRFDAKSPFNFTCQLTMVPKVGWKGDYKDIEVWHCSWLCAEVGAAYNHRHTLSPSWWLLLPSNDQMLLSRTRCPVKSHRF